MTTFHLLDQLEPLHEDAFGWAVVCSAGDCELAKDALQEAYVKVVSGQAVFEGKSSLKTWWLGVVRFTVREQQRQSRRWHRAVNSMLDWLTAIGSSFSECHERDVDTVWDLELLASALAQLPPRQAELLHLVFQQEYSLSEAAAVMDITVGSARQHYDRAKKRLRSILSVQRTKPISSLPICKHVE